MFQHSQKSRHRRVIDQDGLAVDDTRPMGRLWFAAGVSRREDAPQLVSGAATAPGRILPVLGDRTIVMRVPAAPEPPRSGRARDLVQIGFRMAARELDQFVRVLSTGWQRLAVENDRRAASLDARLARMTARQHAWAAAEDGRLLEAAYAQGGTELVTKLTPQVLARMDARAKAGTGVAR